MAEIRIQDAHKPALSRSQHVLEWLQGEQQRLQGELAQIAAAGQREQEKLATFLRSVYHVEFAPGVALDVDKGTITTPDEPATPENVTPFLNRE